MRPPLQEGSTVTVPVAPEIITGRVVSVNPKGLKLAGQDSWLNFSKYAPDVAPPMRGQTVTLTLGRQGFIRAVDAAGGAQDASGRPDPSWPSSIIGSTLPGSTCERSGFWPAAP